MRVGLASSTMVLMATCLACARPPQPEAGPNPLEQAPVDSARVAVGEAAGWSYRREVQADLDGDGQAERVTIASDVTLGTNGAPLWEDGHRWAVMASAGSAPPTLLYGAFVPRGFAEAAVSRPDDQGRRRVLVQERTPEQVRALEIAYEGPGRARLLSAAHYTIEQWLPGAAAMP